MDYRGQQGETIRCLAYKGDGSVSEKDAEALSRLFGLSKPKIHIPGINNSCNAAYVEAQRDVIFVMVEDTNR